MPPAFVDRDAERNWLNALLRRTRPSAAQLVLVYGRRRIGKTVLLRRWADDSGLPVVYWGAETEPAALQRRKAYARVLGVETGEAPAFDSWADWWAAFARLAGDRRQILIMDEVSYASEADPAFLSALQHAWDHGLKDSRAVVVLSGSHVGTLESFLGHGSPLFGRFTGQWQLQPLPLPVLRHFLPRWSAAERIAAYAIVGGVPAYLEWLDDGLGLDRNLAEVLLPAGSRFSAEAELLIYDQLREPRVYLAILSAIGGGAHGLDEIARATLIGKTHLVAYLARLQELRFVERRLPVTVPPARRAASRAGRYHLSDPFLRFHFRFIAPFRDDLGYRPERVLDRVRESLRPFVGESTFEELSRLWLWEASRGGILDVRVQHVGSHWGKGSQVDVVGVDRSRRSVVVGECKWEDALVARSVVTELLEEKTPAVLKALAGAGPKKSWTVRNVIFTRRGLAPAARDTAERHGVIVVDAERLERELPETTA